jgi:uncharacterized protein YecT (DUF1311 family)
MMKHAAVLAALALLSCGAFAASFDCRKAASAPEKLICADTELSRLDDELSLIYQRAKQAAPDQAQFKAQTRAAWQWREANCTTKACLVSWYARRKAQLTTDATTAPSDGCLKDGDVVTLAGRVSRETFPGPPNYESIADGDAPETYWILTLASPNCFAVGSMVEGSTAAVPTPVDRFQLVFAGDRDYQTYAGAVGSAVVATGELFERHTGHHHTAALLTVKNLTIRGK